MDGSARLPYAQERRQASTGMLLILVCRLIPAVGKPNETCPCRGILLIPLALPPRENLIPLSYLLTLSLSVCALALALSHLLPTLDAAATSSPLGLFQLGPTTSPPFSISLLRLLLDCGTTLDALVLPGVSEPTHPSTHPPTSQAREEKKAYLSTSDLYPFPSPLLFALTPSSPCYLCSTHREGRTAANCQVPSGTYQRTPRRRLASTALAPHRSGARHHQAKPPSELVPVRQTRQASTIRGDCALEDLVDACVHHCSP